MLSILVYTSNPYLFTYPSSFENVSFVDVLSPAKVNTTDLTPSAYEIVLMVENFLAVLEAGLKMYAPDFWSLP